MSPKRVNDVVLKDSAAKSATLGFVSNESEEQEHNSQSGYVIVGNEIFLNGSPKELKMSLNEGGLLQVILTNGIASRTLQTI